MDHPQPSIKSRSLSQKWDREQIKILKKKQVQSFRDKWFDSADVLIALGISRRTLQNLRNHDILPFVRLYGKLYYKIKDVNSLLENRYIKRKR